MILELQPELRVRGAIENTFDDWLNIKGDVYRQVAGRRTLRFMLGSQSYFIKIHRGVGWREIFKNILQGRLPVVGAKNEYRAIRKLTDLGIDTMTLAGYGLRGWNPAAFESFVITEAIADSVSLEDYSAAWASRPPSVAEKRALLYKVADITKLLHANGINHRDLYICHFLLKEIDFANRSPVLYLIDLHRAQIRRKAPQRWIVKDLAALYFSSMHIGLTKRDRLRFIRRYRDAPLRAIVSREAALWRRVAARAAALAASPKKD